MPSGFTLTLPPPHRLTVAIICSRESTDGFDEEEVDVESTSEVGGFIIVHVERAIQIHPFNRNVQLSKNETLKDTLKTYNVAYD